MLIRKLASHVWHAEEPNTSDIFDKLHSSRLSCLRATSIGRRLKIDQSEISRQTVGIDSH